MKRHYESVTVAPARDAAGLVIMLDGRVVRTPNRAALVVPNGRLAEAIAAEWRARSNSAAPAAMPLTRLASTACDRVARRRSEVIDELAGYAETDLLCYRAERPDMLRDRQQAIWQPLLDWASGRYGARFKVTAGVVPVAQDAGTVESVRGAVAAHDDMVLAALHAMTKASGSVILGLAVIEGRLDAGEAAAASQLDEQFQIAQWGDDSEAAARRKELAGEIAAAARFVGLLRASD